MAGVRRGRLENVSARGACDRRTAARSTRTLGLLQTYVRAWATSTSRRAVNNFDRCGAFDSRRTLCSSLVAAATRLAEVAGQFRVYGSYATLRVAPHDHCLVGICRVLLPYCSRSCAIPVGCRCACIRIPRECRANRCRIAFSPFRLARLPRDRTHCAVWFAGLTMRWSGPGSCPDLADTLT